MSGPHAAAVRASIANHGAGATRALADAGDDGNARSAASRPEQLRATFPTRAARAAVQIVADAADDAHLGPHPIRPPVAVVESVSDAELDRRRDAANVATP